MKINVISDLHLDFSDLTLPGGDVLILSGDVCEAKNLKDGIYNPDPVLLPGERADRRPDRFNRFFIEECAKYRHVIYVMGNHEHYGFKFHKTYDHIKKNIPANVHLLENETIEIDGVLFLGASLWTDMNNHHVLTMFHMRSMMNDYRQITMFDQVKNAYHKLTPEHTVRVHEGTRQYFKLVLEENRQREGGPLPVVVVTHHSPSKTSTHSRYDRDYIMNGAYSSNLSEFILDNPEIQVWTHGHTHDTFDYMIGTTRIICNPRGYKGYESQAENFDPTIGFEI